MSAHATTQPLAHAGLKFCCVKTWLHAQVTETEGEVIKCTRAGCEAHGIIFTGGA